MPNLDANNSFLDSVMVHFSLKNDAALSRCLQVAPPVISKIRHGRLDVGSTFIIRIHELTGWTIRDIKAELGVPSLDQLPR
jgi:hypothetical protein